MTLQRREIPKVQPRKLREPKPVKKPRQPEGFSASVKDTICARSGGACERDECGPAEVYHHRRARGAGGTSLPWVNRAANGLHVSNACHLGIELNRTRSYMNGWLVSMLGTVMSADVPVLYRGRFVLLRDDGSIRPIEGDCWDESEALA